MANYCVVLLIISLMAAMASADALHADNWATRLESEQGSTTTNLRFYFHDTVSGRNPSAVRVAESTDTNKSPTGFGVVMMADDPLTVESDPNSKMIGKAQGLYGSACKEELALLMAMNFAFTDGDYNGSSISILGKNSALNPVREMPIVGGTGIFRFARGYALAQTHWMDITTGDAVVGYNVTVVH